jgi:FtsP/CotA-like multicopper oxidase with cupredoxin domain
VTASTSWESSFPPKLIDTVIIVESDRPSVKDKASCAAFLHWHGVLVPHEMDGVPGVSFPGIKPGETFTYRYPVQQSGTYWYHSHSGLQEQAGLYGPLIIDPAEPDPFAYDREYVAMLSDWTFEDPHDVLMKLKKLSDYYNFQQRTLGDFFRDVSDKGWRATISDRSPRISACPGRACSATPRISRVRRGVKSTPSPSWSVSGYGTKCRLTLDED